MKTLPNAHLAIVPIEKLRDYSLNTTHRRAQHKARGFRAVLGLTSDQAEWLAEVIRREVIKLPARAKTDSEYGSRYEVDITIDFAGRSALIRTGCIIRQGEIAPRLTTCFVAI